MLHHLYVKKYILLVCGAVVYAMEQLYEPANASMGPGKRNEKKFIYFFVWEILLFRLFRYVRNYIPGIVLRYVDYLKRKNLYNFP